MSNIRIDTSIIYNNLPITLSEAKEHLRVLHSHEDDYIESLIKASVELWWDETRFLVLAASTTVEVVETITTSSGKDYLLLTARPVNYQQDISLRQIKSGVRGDEVLTSDYDIQGNWTRIYSDEIDFTNVDAVEAKYEINASQNESAINAIKLIIADKYERRADAVRERTTAVDRLTKKYRSWPR